MLLRIALSAVVASSLSLATPVGETTLAARNSESAAALYTNAQWSYYNVGQGSCNGPINKATDFVVALNTPQYGSAPVSSYCFQKIQMIYQGKTTNATITDQCPTCPLYGLDLSVGLFEFFAPLSDGLLHGEWQFI